MNFQLNEARRMKHHFTEIDNNDHQIKFLTYSEISNGHQEYWTNFQYYDEERDANFHQILAKYKRTSNRNNSVVFEPIG